MNRKHIIDKFVNNNGSLAGSDFCSTDVNHLLGLISNYLDHPDDPVKETKLPIAFYKEDGTLRVRIV